MTEYTPAKDALLMTIVDLALSEFDDASKDYGRLAEAYRAYKAAQSPAEPKPSVEVSEETVDAALHAYKEWFALDPLEDRPSAKAMLRKIIEATTPYMHAKNSDLAAVIADNDAWMPEIERLKAEVEEWQRWTAEEAQPALSKLGFDKEQLEAQTRADAASIKNLCAELKNRNREIDARRHPDKRARKAWFNGKGQSCWEDVARAVLNIPNGE